MKKSVKYQFKKSEASASDFFVWSLSLLMILVTTSSVQAQEEDKPSLMERIFTRPSYDSNYVESYYHFLHVTLVAINQNHRTSISSPDPNVTMSIRPNTMTTYGFGIDYKFFTIELSKAIDAISQPDPAKGNSKSFAFRMGYTGRRLLGSALIQSHTGMYISNPEEVIPNWDVNTQGYPKRQDIKSTVVFGSLNYFFNHTRYSTMASLWQIDRQKKSAGSWVLGIAASRTSIQGDTALIPPLPPSFTQEPGRLVSGSNYLTGVNVGYCHNFIFLKKIFINFNLIPGVNIQFGQYKTDKDVSTTTKTNVGLHGDFRSTLGYNGERYYWGAYYSNYLIHNPISEFIALNQFNSYFRLFVGRRLDLRKKHR